MIKTVVSKEKIKSKNDLPKLMRGKKTGAIYLVFYRENFSGLLVGVVLSKGSDDSVKIGQTYKYDSFLFEDFDGTLTLTNGD